MEKKQKVAGIAAVIIILFGGLFIFGDSKKSYTCINAHDIPLWGSVHLESIGNKYTLKNVNDITFTAYLEEDDEGHHVGETALSGLDGLEELPMFSDFKNVNMMFDLKSGGLVLTAPTFMMGFRCSIE